MFKKKKKEISREISEKKLIKNIVDGSMNVAKLILSNKKATTVFVAGACLYGAFRLINKKIRS